MRLLRARPIARPAERASRAQWGGTTLFAIPAFLLRCLVMAASWKTPYWAAGLTMTARAATFMACAADTSAAANRAWRTPERTLHTLSLLGGWPGALLAQRLLRHQSIRPDVRQTIWGTVWLNVTALILLVSPLLPRYS